MFTHRKTHTPLFILPLFLFFSTEHAGATSPSFDCAKASTPAEKGICQSDELSVLDSALSVQYRDFVNILDGEQKQLARQMQRNWIVNRDRRCYKYGQNLDEKFRIPDEADIPTSDECMQSAYEEALSALQKGVLVSQYYLFDSMPSYAIGLPGITQITKQAVAVEGWDGMTEQASYYIEHDDGKFLVGTTENIGDGADGVRRGFLEIRSYLDSNGRSYNAVIEAYREWGGRCTDETEVRIRFFDFGDGKLNYYFTADGTQLRLTHGSGGCGGDSSAVIKWGLDDGMLYFDSMTRTSWYYVLKLPRIERYSVGEGRYIVSDAVYKTEDSFNSESFDKIYQDVLQSIWDREAATDCDRMDNDLSDYYAAKGIIDFKGISRPQAFYFAPILLQRLNEFDAIANYVPTMKEFLSHLDKIREIDGWQTKLVEAVDQYPQVNYNYLKPDVYRDVNPFTAAGFDLQGTCSATGSSVNTMSLYEWIHAFWARRVTDGDLEQTEAVLRSLVGFYKP